MRSNPERLAIRTKLLEVYAKRRDIKGFELLATQLFALTRGEGEDWAKAQELGPQIDPENPLYQAGGAPGASERGRRRSPSRSARARCRSRSSRCRRSSAPRSAPTRRSTTARSAIVDLDLDNPDVGLPSQPAPLDATESCRAAHRRRGRLPAVDAQDAADLERRPVAASGPDTRDDAARLRPLRHHPRPRQAGATPQPSTTASDARRFVDDESSGGSARRASSSWPRSSSASATRTAPATCCARCSPPPAARPRPRRRGCSTTSN